MAIETEPVPDLDLETIEERPACLHIFAFDKDRVTRISEWTYCGRFKALSEPGRPYTNANPICLDCASWLDDDELAESPYCDHPRRWCVRPDCKFGSPRCTPRFGAGS